MLKISETGNGLNILMLCEYTRHHDWMSFASWYSIYKNLPDATVEISCLRTNCQDQLFNWPVKCNVTFSQVSKLEHVVDKLTITPDIMAVSYYDINNLGPVDVKSDDNFTFVSYFRGCGKFVYDQWINTLRNPLVIAEKLFTEDISLNESRVLKLWGKAYTLYRTIA